MSEPEQYELVGDIISAGCMENLDDMVAVSCLAWDGKPHAALVETCQEVDEDTQALCQIVVGSKDARRLAAALLNVADLIEGIAPLSICPDPAAHGGGE